MDSVTDGGSRSIVEPETGGTFDQNYRGAAFRFMVLEWCRLSLGVL